MPQPVLFIQGAGEGAYDEDAVLVEHLRQGLGDGYEVVYPAMADEGNAPYDVWKARIDVELTRLSGPVILVGHSVGGSVLAKFLVERPDRDQIAGTILLAAPYWGGDGWRYDGYEELELPPALNEKLDLRTPTFLYHCQDDEIVSVEHLMLYRRLLAAAAGRVLHQGGHQFDTDLAPIVTDIQGVPSASSRNV